jgi:predicted transcriptional regulator
LAAPDESVAAILNRFGSSDGHVLVMENGRLVGLVTPADITRALGDSVLKRGKARVSS